MALFKAFSTWLERVIAQQYPGNHIIALWITEKNILNHSPFRPVLGLHRKGIIVSISRREFFKKAGVGTASAGLLAGGTSLSFGKNLATEGASKEDCCKKVTVLNPYRYIDWESVPQYKSNLHCHTKLHKIEKDGTIIEHGKSGYDESNGKTYGSDGWYLPDVVIDEYKKYGFHILALTDHNPFYGYGKDAESYGTATTHPWTLWNRTPEELGMIAVEGKELTNPQDYEHDISLFNSLGDLDQSNGYDRIERLKAVSDHMGLLSLAHPRKKITVSEMVTQAKRHYVSVALEVFTRSGRRGTRGALDYWDEILTETMPFLPIWGISVDDMHTFDQLGTNWCMHLLPEFHLGAVRHSLVRGEFYFSIDSNGNDIKRHRPIQAPVIDKIEVDGRKIKIYSRNTNHISWISEGNPVFTGNTLDLDKVVVGSYVRAELIGKQDEITGTQPFGIIHGS